jgi:protocatechuate 3,4-dioxygenase, alpha subunit
LQAPHILVSVFARGLLKRVATRVYFPDEAEANEADPVLSSVEDQAQRSALVATAENGGLRFDIHLQGESQTAFFGV